MRARSWSRYCRVSAAERASLLARRRISACRSCGSRVCSETQPASSAAKSRTRSLTGRTLLGFAAFQKPRCRNAEDEPPERRADVEDRHVGDGDEEAHQRAEAG